MRVASQLVAMIVVLIDLAARDGVPGLPHL